MNGGPESYLPDAVNVQHCIMRISNKDVILHVDCLECCKQCNPTPDYVHQITRPECCIGKAVRRAQFAQDCKYTSCAVLEATCKILCAAYDSGSVLICKYTNQYNSNETHTPKNVMHVPHFAKSGQ